MGSPRRGVVVLALGLMVAGCSDDGGDAGRTEPAPRSTRPAELATTTTEPPRTGAPLVVAQQGVSTFPDPADPTATLGGYGVILHNPNPDLMATGVHVTTRILDAAGTELLSDGALLNAVMPGGHMAVGRTLIEPIDDPVGLDVHVEVAAWIEPAEEGELVAEGVVTEPEEGGGSVTRFTIRSTWPAREEGVDVTAVYRAEDGRILSAESTTIREVAGNGTVEGAIRLLSPIPGVTATDVFVGRGFAAQTTG